MFACEYSPSPPTPLPRVRGRGGLLGLYLTTPIPSRSHRRRGEKDYRDPRRSRLLSVLFLKVHHRLWEQSPRKVVVTRTAFHTGVFHASRHPHGPDTGRFQQGPR